MNASASVALYKFYEWLGTIENREFSGVKYLKRRRAERWRDKNSICRLRKFIKYKSHCFNMMNVVNVCR